MFAVLLKRKKNGGRFAESGRRCKDGEPVALQGELLDAIAEQAAQRNGGELQFCLKERRFHVFCPSDSSGFERYSK